MKFDTYVADNIKCYVADILKTRMFVLVHSSLLFQEIVKIRVMLTSAPMTLVKQLKMTRKEKINIKSNTFSSFKN